MKPPSGPKKQTQTKPISSKAKIACRKIRPHPNLTARCLKCCIHNVNKLYYSVCVISRIRGGSLKPWPEFVEGLFGGVLRSKTWVLREFIGLILC